MAQLRDFPHVVRSVGLWTFIKRVWSQIDEDTVFTWGAALAYSWMFAVFPFLIFLLSLVPFVPETYKPSVRDNVTQMIDKAFPGDAASILRKQVDNLFEKPSAGGFLSFGLLLTIWAASGGMAMTMSALDKAYDIEKSRNYFKQRIIAIALTMAVAILMLLVMILLPIGSAAVAWMDKHMGGLGILGWIFNIARLPIAIVLLLFVVAMIWS